MVVITELWVREKTGVEYNQLREYRYSRNSCIPWSSCIVLNCAGLPASVRATMAVRAQTALTARWHNTIPLRPHLLMTSSPTSRLAMRAAGRCALLQTTCGRCFCLDQERKRYRTLGRACRASRASRTWTCRATRSCPSKAFTHSAPSRNSTCGWFLHSLRPFFTNNQCADIVHAWHAWSFH